MSSSELSSYEETRLRHAAYARQLMPTYLDRLRWPGAAIAAEQTRALRQLLRHAADRSAWHRERLRHVDVDRVEPAELRVVPTMSKTDLMEHWDAIVTDPEVTLAGAEWHLATHTTDAYFRGRYHVIASGGSSGQRGVFVYDWHGWAISYVGTARGLLATMNRLSLSPDGVFASVAADVATHASAAIAQTFRDAHRRIVHAPATLPLAAVVAILNRTQPMLLHAYPSMLPALCDEAGRGTLRITPSLVWCTSEPLLPEVRAAAETTWGTPVLNAWAASESIGGAFPCAGGAGFHLGEDVNVIELVDERGHPTPRGERAAKILVTNLYNRILPLIRYEISDELHLATVPCACGVSYLKAEDMLGRHCDVFDYAGGVRVHPIHFASVFGTQPAVRDFQVRQTERGVEVDLVGRGAVDLEGIRAALLERLSAAQLPRPEVAVRLVESVPRQVTGKARRFVPRRESVPCGKGSAAILMRHTQERETP